MDMQPVLVHGTGAAQSFFKFSFLSNQAYFETGLRLEGCQGGWHRYGKALVATMCVQGQYRLLDVTHSTEQVFTLRRIPRLEFQ